MGYVVLAILGTILYLLGFIFVMYKRTDGYFDSGWLMTFLFWWAIIIWLFFIGGITTIMGNWDDEY